ncbi:MAG: hypothetical protein WA771_10995, partial [Chthoniobacterales bacterium]
MKTIDATSNYYVKITYFYYDGTFNARANGPLKDQNGQKMLFESREDAKKFLLTDNYELEWLRCEETKSGIYMTCGDYCLKHGEYS